MAEDRVERLDYAERWFRDGLRAIDPPGGLLSLEVDMSNAAAFRERMKERGSSITYNTLLVHAAATALTTHPELHRLLAGNKRLFPVSVDICLSIAGEAVVTPVIIIKNAGSKSLIELAGELRGGVDTARLEDQKTREVLKRWGWLVPFAFLRRNFIGFLLGQPWYRRKASGTFQVTVVSTVDFCVPFLFNTAAALGAGRVQDRVVPVDGRIEIRPVLVLSCCIDHKVWNGMDAAMFLNAVKGYLEQLAG